MMWIILFTSPIKARTIFQGFNLRGDGFLAPLAASPFAAGSGPSAVAIDNTGKFAYVVNSASNSVSVYRDSTLRVARWFSHRRLTVRDGDAARRDCHQRLGSRAISRGRVAMDDNAPIIKCMFSPVFERSYKSGSEARFCSTNVLELQPID